MYGAGANSYIMKPKTFDRLIHVFHVINEYWTDTVLLPPVCGTTAR